MCLNVGGELYSVARSTLMQLGPARPRFSRFELDTSEKSGIGHVCVMSARCPPGCSANLVRVMTMVIAVIALACDR